MSPKKSYNHLVLFALAIAILAGALIAGMSLYDQLYNLPADEFSYRAANHHYSKQHFTKAKTSYLIALQENPNLVEAYAGLAKTMLQTQQYDEALRFINEAIELSPKVGSYFAVRGLIYDHSKRYIMALREYEKAELLTPDLPLRMSWYDKLFLTEKSHLPSISKRLKYLKKQMALPKSDRVIGAPTFD